ncbi:MAG: signal peptidase I [Alphaproteobacteria bacterium]
MHILLKDFLGFLKTLAIAAFLAFFCIRGFIFEPFRIPSGSMMPTLLVGDFLFVSKFAYGNRIPLTDIFLWQGEPKRGDIIVFKNRNSELPGSFFGFGTPMFIKRLVAVPGDTISYAEGKILTVNGQALPQTAGEPYAYQSDETGQVHTATRKQEDLLGITHDILIEDAIPAMAVREMTVPEGSYVMMGDNRDNSRDSRYWNIPNWGFVPRADVMGRAEFIFWSWDNNWQPRFERLLNSLRAHKTEAA